MLNIIQSSSFSGVAATALLGLVCWEADGYWCFKIDTAV